MVPRGGFGQHASSGQAPSCCLEAHRLRRIGVVILTGMLAVVAVWITPATADTTLRILHLNDTHGRSQNHHYAREAALIESLREEYRPENCLLVHSGDLVSKGNMFTAKTKGQGEIAYLNELGLDVWTLGNGDLYGSGDYSYYDRFPPGAENARQLVGNFRGQALSANYLTADRSAQAIAGTTPYCVREITTSDGRSLRIGFVGLTEVYANQLAGQGDRHVGRDYAWYAKDAVDKLRQVEDVDLIIPVTHVGYYADEKTRDGVKYIAPVDQRIIRDVAGFPSLLGGHDHIPRTPAVPRYSRTSDAGERFSYDSVQYGNSGYGMGDYEKEWWSPPGSPLGVLTLVLDDNGQVKSTEYTLKELPAYDPNDPVQQRYEQFLNEWIQDHAVEYGDPYYGPLTYADLDTAWPAVWPTSGDLEEAPVSDTPALPPPIYIRGETRTIADHQWALPGQDVFIGDAAEVRVIGPGGRWDLSDSTLYVGDQGRATLEIAGSDSYVSAGRCAIGGWENTADPTAAVGTVLVRGGWLNVVDWLDVGSYGQGQLFVTEGGQVSSGAAFVGFAAGSEGLAEIGAGSYWDSGDMFVGHRGSGTVRIVQGGILQSGLVVLGGQAGSDGTVLISGAGSTWYVGDPDRAPGQPIELDAGRLGDAAIGLADGGRLYVVRDMRLAAQSWLDVLFTENTPFQSIAVGGTADLAGHLSVDVVRPTFGAYVLLEAQSLVDNMASVTISNELLLVRYALASDPRRLVLQGQLSPDHRLFDFASTPNAFALSCALDQALSDILSTSVTQLNDSVADEGAPFGGLLSHLVAETDPRHLQNAVDSLVPETAALPDQAAVEGAFWFGQYATRQLRSRHNPGLSPLDAAITPIASLDDLFASAEADVFRLASAGSEDHATAGLPAETTADGSLQFGPVVRGQAPVGDDDWLWGTTYGAYRDQESGANRPGYHHWSTGFLAGAEVGTTEQTATGFVAAYDFSQLATYAGGGEMNTLRFGPYFSWQDDDARFVDGVLSGGLHWSDLERSTAYGRIDGNPLDADVSMIVNTGRDFRLGRSTLTPSAGLVYTQLFADSYSESNAGAGGMRLASSELSSLRSTLGANLARTLAGGRRTIVAEAQGGWVHEYLDEGPLFQATFLEYHDSFLLSFGSPDRDAAYFGTGLSSTLGPGAIISLKYIGLAGAHSQSHTGLLHLGVCY
jgi:T5SS/PEP-CTERM-associated repeat protein